MVRRRSARDQLTLFDVPAAPAPAAAIGTGEPLPDAEARRRIREDLDATLLVEAGAGAGKTTEMLARMVALVRSGRARIDEIAAVTFTRKAAAELRERLQLRLEVEAREARERGDRTAGHLIDRALRDLDRAFVGTIHSFCARLLRERPLEAGLDPGFRETFGPEELRLRAEFWSRHLERLHASDSPLLDELRRVGLRTGHVRDLFEIVSDNPDVEFPAPAAPRPDPSAVRRRLEQLLDGAEGLIPDEEPASGWDRLQQRVRALRFHRWVLDWRRSDLVFFEALAVAFDGRPDVKRDAWPPTRYDAARALEHALETFTVEGGEAARLLEAWWAHRYPVAVRFARHAAEEYARERLRNGAVTFQDLLMFAARMLREHAAARRDLAQRYRYLLVDEFQDTDPVQAEVLLLLAADDAEQRDWRTVRPRAGALFVVGDPKQSIYRFRRADITLYMQVRALFERWSAERPGSADVVSLVSNFRSLPAIGDFVNRAFSPPDAGDTAALPLGAQALAAGRFPSGATDGQAAFAELRTRRTDGAGCVAWYELAPTTKKYDAVIDDDAERIASWIAARVTAGERRPGDFMILTRMKKPLASYARALEARNLAVQVTGAAVGVEEELRELLVVLDALLDPGDPTRVAAALVGLFFGIDYEQLTRWVLAERARFPGVDPFDYTHYDPRRFSGPVPDDPVAAALATLARWRALALEHPADVAVSAIADELGLLPYAAAGDLGESRAGALAFALEAVRQAALRGEATLGGAVAALQAALDSDEAEAPLQPGRPDVVRVMNLHKAKGLESPVVILAYPVGDRDRAPDRHVSRPADGAAQGWVCVREQRGWNWTTLAQPLDWPRHEEAERGLQAAEDVRLLYVAATRARDELTVSRARMHDATSPWRVFNPVLERAVEPIALHATPRPARVTLDATAAVLQDHVDRIAQARAAARAPRYRAAPVTARVKSSGGSTGRPRAARERGTEWGSAVHAALAAASEAPYADRDALRAICRAALLGVQWDVDPRTGEPENLERLVGTVHSVLRSPLWQRAQSARRRLSEVAFADPRNGGGQPTDIWEGVIDLAFEEDDGWVIVDYKTDAATGPELERRREVYRRQVDAYAECFASVAGAPVKERVILWLRAGEVESW